MKIAFVFALFAATAMAATVKLHKPLEEEFGYVEVRKGAHMFWVMYHIDQNSSDYATFPLILWLQGGPGGSGVGYGNFMELGPQDINGNARPYAWTKKANVMFIDNPVGTGYSYVEEDSLYSTNNSQIAADLVVCVKEAFKTNKAMEDMPFYVFAESYGGKMTVDFALAFHEAISKGEVKSDFRGVALGDSWISPMDSVNTWAPYLYSMGFVNENGREKIEKAANRTQEVRRTKVDNVGFVNKNGREEIEKAANKTQDAVDKGSWWDASFNWGKTETAVEDAAHGVNFYNVLAKDDIYAASPATKGTIWNSGIHPAIDRLYRRHVHHRYSVQEDALSKFMNGPQKAHWKIPENVVWGANSGKVFNKLYEDFMKPVVDSVSNLLNNTNITVAVYTGNLDLICDTPGTYRWIENMEWTDKQHWMAQENHPLYVSEYTSQAATRQKYNRFSLYTIFRSGHMTPVDAPEVALNMVEDITADVHYVYSEDSIQH